MLPVVLGDYRRLGLALSQGRLRSVSWLLNNGWLVTRLTYVLSVGNKIGTTASLSFVLAKVLHQLTTLASTLGELGISLGRGISVAHEALLSALSAQLVPVHGLVLINGWLLSALLAHGLLLLLDSVGVSAHTGLSTGRLLIILTATASARERCASTSALATDTAEFLVTLDVVIQAHIEVVHS